MAEDTTSGISLYLEIPVQHQNLLAPIRHWDALRAAYMQDTLWLRGITPQLANSPVLKAIPYIKLYTEKDGLLFPYGSLLPQRKIPQGLLWSPMQNILPVDLPPLNHNYFGVHDGVEFRIVRQKHEQEATTLLCQKDDVAAYLNQAPAIRVQHLAWIGVNGMVLIIGTPLLPIKGAAFWNRDNFLYPAGFGPELHIIEPLVQNTVDPSGSSLVLWDADSSYITIPRNQLMPLSLSSFRLTFS